MRPSQLTAPNWRSLGILRSRQSSLLPFTFALQTYRTDLGSFVHTAWEYILKRFNERIADNHFFYRNPKSHGSKWESREPRNLLKNSRRVAHHSVVCLYLINGGEPTLCGAKGRIDSAPILTGPSSANSTSESYSSATAPAMLPTRVSPDCDACSAAFPHACVH